MKKFANITRQMVRTTGAARNTLEQIRLFNSMGWEAHVFSESINAKDAQKAGGIPHRVFVWPVSNFKKRLQFASRAQKKIKKMKFDLVFGHGDIFEQDVLFLHNCVHLTHELLDGKPLPEKQNVGQIHKKILTDGKFKLVICNSDLMKNDLVKRFNLNPNILETIHPGYNPDKFNMISADKLREHFRKQWNLEASDLAIGLVTSGSFKKRNVEGFIRAMAILPAETKKCCKFIVVGKGPDSGWEKKLVSELNMERCFIFQNPITDIEKIYHALDIQILPAKWEEFGRVVLEGMACGNPIIVSKNVGSSALFEGPSRNFILDIVDTENLAAKALQLIENTELRNMLSNLNITTANKYTEHEQSRKLTSILEKHKLY